MRAVVLTAPGAPLELQEVPDPVAPAGGAVVDVLACGICHSDLHAAAGDYTTTLPVILGHEVAAHHPELGPVLVYACWGCRRPDCWACSPLSLRSSQWSTQRLPPAPREPSAGTQHNW